MTRTVRLRAGIALLAAATVALLTGCTAEHGAVPGAGTTARPAAETRFACPAVEDVAALVAVPFTVRTTAGDRCTYSTTVDAAVSAEVVLRHPAAGASRGTTLAALRDAAETRGADTADARRLAFDAFTAVSKRDCTVTFPASDGVLTSVTAREDGTPSTKDCKLATAVATLAGPAPTESAAPVVAVLADRHLLGTTTADASWPWRIGRDAGVRIDRRTTTGYSSPSGTTSLAAAAARLPTGSTAVVFVSGTQEAGASRLEILRDATAAFSAAAARAPKAKLVVVGPVADGSAGAADVAALSVDLRAAANIAGARFVDAPIGGSLTDLADGIASALRAEGVAAG